MAARYADQLRIKLNPALIPNPNLTATEGEILQPKVRHNQTGYTIIWICAVEKGLSKSAVYRPTKLWKRLDNKRLAAAVVLVAQATLVTCKSTLHYVST